MSKFKVVLIGNTGSNNEHPVYNVSAEGSNTYTVTPGLGVATWVHETQTETGYKRQTVTCSPLKTLMLIDVIHAHLRDQK